MGHNKVRFHIQQLLQDLKHKSDHTIWDRS